MRPEEAWQRVRTRTTTPKFLAIVRELARFRESYAQTKDIPRNRVFKDDAMLELASTKPSSVADLGRSRLLLREARRGEIAEGILAAVQAGLPVPSLAAALAWYDAMRQPRGTADLIQAQRDYFGEHGFERTDDVDDSHGPWHGHGV